MRRFSLSNHILSLLCLILLTSLCLGENILKTETPRKGPVAPIRREVPGTRYSLSTGQLFIPDFYRVSRNNNVTLVLFFHGASWCVEQSFYDAHRNAVLVSISLKDYYTAYQDTTSFQGLVDEIKYSIETIKGTQNLNIDKIYLTSFSGGYPVIRSILNHSPQDERIQGIILADSLYAGFEGTTRSIETLRKDQMEPFLRFSGEAAKGKKEFWFTQLYPPKPEHRNNTTTLTAEYLITHLRLKKEERNHRNSLGMVLAYSAERRNAHILGYDGMTTQDHFNHLYNLSEYFKSLKIPPAHPSIRMTNKGSNLPPGFQP